MKKKILTQIFYWAGVLYIAITGGGGCNVFTDMSNRTSDQAIIDDANNLIDRSFYNDAILKLNLLSAAGQARRDVKVLYAAAYAGRGGLDLLNLSLTLSGSGNPPTLFLTLLKAFKGTTWTQYNDQLHAESYMTGISLAASGRTADENMFTVFVELAKLGTLFSFTADPLGNGTVDPGVTVCSTTSAQADQVVTALGIIVDSMTALGNNALSGSLTPVLNQCALLGGACNVTQTSNVTGVMEQLAKTLVGETNLNLGLQITQAVDQCELSGGGGNCMGTFTPFCP